MPQINSKKNTNIPVRQHNTPFRLNSPKRLQKKLIPNTWLQTLSIKACNLRIKSLVESTIP